jgi:DNA (cytosine-5)-methyltransferase 1
MLASHDRGNTLARILDVLVELGYSVSYRILNALDFGLPQKRERIVIVGFLRDADFVWPLGGAPMKPLREVLEEEVSEFYQASSAIQESRMSRQCPEEEPTIWHENKSGNISKHPYSCALRAGASYNYLLVNGRRRLTEREMFRLQGFPDEFLIHQTYTVARRHAGNSVPVPMIEAVLNSVLDALMERSPISEGSDRGKELKERT